MPLTIKTIEKLSAPGRHFDEHGLYLQVRNARCKSWVYRYEAGGRERWMGLGSWADVSLAEARERARSARKLARDGRDPIQERQTAKRAAKDEVFQRQAKSKTFAVVAQEYFDRHHMKWTNAKHAAQFLSTLRQYAFPAFGDVPIANVDRDLLLKALEAIWYSKPETASRVRRRIENVLSFATGLGYRSGDNPAAWSGNLSLVFPERSQIRKPVNHRRLPYNEINAFISQLRKREGVAARALEFLILTAARTSEVTGAIWQEIDLNKSVWTVPAERMKANREHKVPLSDAAIALLTTLPREAGNPYLFIGGRKDGLSNMAMDAVLKRMGAKDRATVHGFRSSFRDWASEETDFQNHVAEAALAHTIGDKVERAYRRGDLLEKRRALMSDWARFCLTPSSPAETVSIVRAS